MAKVRDTHAPIDSSSGRCPHPEYVKPFTKNKIRNRRPSGSPDIEWCELCWKGLSTHVEY